MRNNRLALLIGIQNYQYLGKLKYPESDALTIEEALKDYNCLFSCTTLLNEEAKSSIIINTFKELIKLASDDAVIIFYYAGHAINYDGTTFFVTLESEDDFEKGVDFHRITQIVQTKLKPNQVCIFLLDCCHAGALGVENLSINMDSIYQKVMGHGKGTILIAATEEDKTALESDTLKQGVFTDCLFDGLIGGAANSRGEITVHSLHEYVSNRITEYHKSKQKIVYKTAMSGEPPVIGAGFTPMNISTPTRLTEPKLQEILNLIKDKIEYLREKTKQDLSLWMKEGYKEVSSQLSELILWRSKLEYSHPELRTHIEFRSFDSQIIYLQTHLTNLYPGIIISEGHTIITEIGVGGFGTVYRVQTPTVDLAYKVYHANLLHEKGRVKAFRRGFHAMKKLNHKNIVKVYDLTEAPLGFFMDYIDGQNFETWWTDNPTDYLEILLTIARTLEFAHTQPSPIIHRDIKPANIIISDYSPENITAYLTDFDLAWYSMSSTYSTMGDKVVETFGTFLYSAPEQYETGNDEVKRTPLTDIYGFGQLCYFAIYGKHPGRDKSICIGNLREALKGWENAKAAKEFLTIYDKCTQRTPSHRFQSINELAIELSKVRNYLLDPDLDKSLVAQDFIEELIFSLFGFNTEPKTIFFSYSERTQINIENITNSKIDINFDVISGFNSLSGSFNEQRITINKRIEKEIKEIKNQHQITIKRRERPIDDAYGTSIEILGDYLSLNGVKMCSEIIKKIISAIER